MTAVPPAQTSPRRPARRRVAGAVLGAVLATAVAGSAPVAVAATGAPMALRVEAEGCRAVPVRGSGVAVGGARVATVAHVVAGATAVTVVGPDGRERAAVVVALDPDRDLALLDAADLSEPAVALAPLRAGQTGTYRGYGQGPAAATVAFTVAQAASVVSEDIYVKGSYARPGYILDARVAHGDSGAGLIGPGGSLGGLVWATSRNDDGQGWGISAEALAPLLAATPAGAPPAPPVPCPLA